MPGFGTSTSSLIGANFGNSDATALFALGTLADATNGQTVQYVEATGTFTTGELLTISPNGTAKTFVTAEAVLTAAGIEIAAAQGVITQGQFGWVARNGRNLYVLCTGTIAAGASVGLAAVADGGGKLQIATGVAVNFTLFGIYITTSASTGTASAAVATLSWPRVAASVGA